MMNATHPIRNQRPSPLGGNAYQHLAVALVSCLLATATLLTPMPVSPFVKPFIVVAVALLPLVTIMAVNFTFAISLLFIGFAFFRFHEAFPLLLSLRIPLLLSIAILLVLGYSLITARTLRLSAEPELILFALFFIWCVMGVPFAENVGAAKAFLVESFWKIAIMTLAIAWIMQRPDQFANATKFIVASGSIIGMVALYNKMMGIGLVEGTRVTISRDIGSSLGDPNDLSLRLLFPLSFAAALVMVPKARLLKLFGLAGVVIMIAAIIATQSRGGLLGLLAVMAVFGHRYIRSKIILVALAVIAAFALATLAGLSSRISGGAHEAGLDASSMGRIHAWHTALEMVSANPLTGVGLNNFIANYYFYTAAWDGKPHAVHSTWLGVLAETGIIGFLLFMAMVIVLSVRLLKHSKLLDAENAPESLRTTALAALAGMAGFAVAGTFLTQGFEWPLYILTAFAIALARYCRAYKEARLEKSVPACLWQPAAPQNSEILWVPPHRKPFMKDKSEERPS